jgi:GAF domain-containing protein
VGEIINLRMVRKRQKREDNEVRADENRRRYGRTGSEKELEKREADAHRAHLDAHRLDSGDK